MGNSESKGQARAEILPLEVDFRQRMPITEQIRNQIRALIGRGVLRPGDQLPTVRQLAADLRINFNTVARAYRLLEEDGLISVQHGRGTFVLAPTSSEAEASLKRQTLALLAQNLAKQAREMGFSLDETTEALRRAWQEDEPP